MTADPSAALAAIRARVEAATEGPWFASVDGREVRGRYDGTHSTQVALTHRHANAEFIAHARDDVRRMADALAAVLAFSVDDVARLLSDEWARVDPTSGPGQYPASYIATFADLARVVVAANCAAITDALGADR